VGSKKSVKKERASAPNPVGSELGETKGTSLFRQTEGRNVREVDKEELAGGRTSYGNALQIRRRTVKQIHERA